MKKGWTVKVFFLTFILAILFSLIANLLGDFNNLVLIICIIAIIFIGIIFDIIGTSVLSASTKVLHSKATQKMKGAKSAINLVKNSSTVSSICNDVVGDICGIISGSLVTVLIINLFKTNNISLFNVLITSLLSSLTVGGKAIGKVIAIKKSNDIVFTVGKIIAFIKKEK